MSVSSVLLRPNEINNAPVAPPVVSRVPQLPTDLKALVFSMTGNANAASVSRDSLKAMNAVYNKLLNTYLADPKMARYVPQTDESASIRLQKTRENVMAIARPIANTLPMNLNLLSPLADLRPIVDLVEDRNLIRIFFKKIINLVPPASRPNFNTVYHKERADAIRDWMQQNPALLDQITELDLARLGLTTLPPEIGLLTRLEKLILKFNKLKTLPPEIELLTRLRVLNLGGNELTTLPSEIGRQTQLRFLYLFANQLATLPPEIGQLTGLLILDLEANRLTTLPPGICQLTGLEVLRLGYNQLIRLSSEIGRLTLLRTLDLHDNKLTTIPTEIIGLARLEHLTIYNNEINALPAEFADYDLTTRYIDLRPNLNLHWRRFKNRISRTSALINFFAQSVANRIFSQIARLFCYLTQVSIFPSLRNKVTASYGAVTSLTQFVAGGVFRRN